MSGYALALLDKRTVVIDFGAIWCEAGQAFDMSAPALGGYVMAVLNAGLRMTATATVRMVVMGEVVVLYQVATLQGNPVGEAEAEDLVRIAFERFKDEQVRRAEPLEVPDGVTIH